MTYKTINLAPVVFLDSVTEVNLLVGNWVKYSDLIYIKQPSTDTRIPTKYQESDHFQRLKQLIEIETKRVQVMRPNYQNNICVACAFVDQNENEIVSSTQNASLHIFEKNTDEACFRELQKIRGLWKSQDGYEMCSGCAADNHGEANAIRAAIKESKLDQLEGSTAYITNHWWACDPCRQKMFDLGVKQIILDPICERIFGDKPVEWYRDNDL